MCVGVSVCLFGCTINFSSLIRVSFFAYKKVNRKERVRAVEGLKVVHMWFVVAIVGCMCLCVCVCYLKLIRLVRLLLLLVMGFGCISFD